MDAFDAVSFGKVVGAALGYAIIVGALVAGALLIVRLVGGPSFLARLARGAFWTVLGCVGVSVFVVALIVFAV